MHESRTRVIVEIALTVALAAVLRRFAVWQMPFGGSVSLDMLPLVVLAVRRGVRVGVTAGVLFGFVDLLIEPYIVHWAQVILDYPLAFGLVGLAGLVHPLARRGVSDAATPRARTLTLAWTAAAGALIGATARFASHFTSGVIFFAANAPKGQPVLVYSAVYNLTYLLPSAVAAAILAAVLLPALELAVPSAVPARG
jgi:thiamine transporter